MPIKLIVDDIVRVPVAGTLTREADELDFDFELTVRRPTQGEISAFFDAPGVEPARKLLEARITGWRGVFAETGDELAYSSDALGALLDAFPGLWLRIMFAVNDASGARGREKN